MTEELCRAKFEEWFSEIQQPAMNTVGIKRAEQKMVKSASFMAYQAAWNTRAKMEKSDD